ncbi:GNAT family N-acetyltransferase [Sulfuricurvum sp.]|uniref:GNAT family N-acetyltransferase n=1 Tax=Sulfuricurvum sp. TaxID=2025608 RepID=UPI00286DB1E5|nr:GNAT family N-acetyltransferase [Sulfuricurvum sp.]
MTIRFATVEDIPQVVEVGYEIQRLSRFGQLYEFDHKRVTQQVNSIIQIGQDKNKTHCLFVAVNSKNKIVGLLIGSTEQHIFSDQIIASIVIIGVLQEHRMSGAGLRLLSAFRKWAENRGAVELYAGINSGNNLSIMDRYMKRLGFVQTGGNYALALNQSNKGEEQK